MKIAVIADTHVPHKFDNLSIRLKEGLKGADLILHCGDIVEPRVLEEISQFAPVEAVAGNHDIDYFGSALERKKVIEMAGYRIGMIHGDELDELHVNKTEQADLIFQIVVQPFLFGEPVDCIVFGHSHKPFVDSFRAEFRPPGRPGKKIKHNVLVFNPGMPLRNRHLASMGYIHLEDQALRVEIKVFTCGRGEN
ncbi:MAG: metallophosphoesterase family protein [Desulfitobacteriaceae bacterium]|nr:metallophosphoesterase family protein [Desulfitobacteriaceae bacterium]MDD4752068.1 metallophosphoesterase family protein [Desulfitobacteriaceae bacterium]